MPQISIQTPFDIITNSFTAMHSSETQDNNNNIDIFRPISPSAALRQKRHGSNSYIYKNQKRIARPDDKILNANININYIDHNSIVNENATPVKSVLSRRPSLSKKSNNVTPQPSFLVTEPPKSPFYVTNQSYTNIDVALSANNNGITNNNNQYTNMNTYNSINNNYNNIEGYSGNAVLPGNDDMFINTQSNKYRNNSTSTAIINDVSDNFVNNMNTDIQQNENIYQDQNFNDDTGNNNAESDNNQNNSNDESNNQNSEDNNDNPNNNNNNVEETSVTKKTSRVLIEKLQNIYKIIVKQEMELQQRCSQLTTSQTTELKNLWSIYKLNTDLINNYITFITTALLPSQSLQDIQIGEEIVEIYRIERRLWVYGTITFLDVLKNFSNFMDPEVCSQFITHVFISLSTMLIDLPPKHSIPWLQRLGDLSRMAIALYPSGFIDWKLSAEHWYMEAMKFTYSHGKLYYHMSTVQQNTLEAFVNLGKSVFCQDTFTPSQQYMQLVIDNIYQRTFVDRNKNGNVRNSDLIDYLKHSEVMLLPSFLENEDLQQVVLNYFNDRFGVDYNDNNIFETQDMFFQVPASLRFYFRHAPAFAESHILQLVGFGNPKNPFALLFDLPNFLKERKDKKEKNKSKSSTEISTMSIDTNDSRGPILNTSAYVNEGNIVTEYFDNIDSLRLPIDHPNILVWLKSLEHLNMTSLKCSVIVLRKFLRGPLLIALPHVLPWTYFIIATFLKAQSSKNTSSVKFWTIVMRRILPWNTLTSFLNVLLAYILDNFYQTESIAKLCETYSNFENFYELLDYFNRNENLPEIWKCWGTLWFDVISNKRALNADTFNGLGIEDHMFLDFPLDGIGFDELDETGENFWNRALRIVFLFKGIAENLQTGLRVSRTAPVHCRRDDIDPNHILKSFSFKMEGFDESSYSGQPFSTINKLLPLFENIDETNLDFDARPMLSVVKGENIFEYVGYKKLFLNNHSFDRNGELVSSSIYTAWVIDNDNSLNNSQGNQYTSNMQMTQQQRQLLPPEQQNFQMRNFASNEDTEDDFNFELYMNPEKLNKNMDQASIWTTANDEINRNITYFVFDATSWLRHFAHIYKLSTNNVLNFAVCLTTFQELRFLRKSKDENVVGAAARAIITMRQLYSEGKLLPLRFTGNVATDIEEHLEFEEQITWRSHVDEFVIEAVVKAQNKFISANESVTLRKGFNHVVLVTDDINMKRKAQEQGIKTFTTHFIFSVCRKLGIQDNVCTN
ncbi:hypothetical protein KAFR_0H00180 [Kazachstania africana CBS 2517]|uniref:PIN domain-containing protein n=1 Tax=Kazachstania africana (strain ATCC 22294 / BCRC 22015 / CBS 2517 / CECT 1963 / NBRC 1671 / NRRL Y-8276) TaxID=1071382 RepID=H2AYM1_KAZAF|nr:hypothetical protein KAFR_0H00180 [Kazachstania africana CBS 2517]CCF59427.1 hypothetical protein KAFR_0H00180 [Kazachstania africana CBS 2517]